MSETICKVGRWSDFDYDLDATPAHVIVPAGLHIEDEELATDLPHGYHLDGSSVTLPDGRVAHHISYDPPDGPEWDGYQEE